MPPTKLAIPNSPRAITRRAARRAWAEPGVQFWWKSALVVLLVTSYVAYNLAQAALRQRYLVNHGVIVEAKAVRVLGVTERDNARYGVPRDQSIPVEFETILPDARLVTLSGYLPAGPGWIKVNQLMKLRVDPNDLTHWDEALDVQPWWQVLAVPLFLMLPVALLLLGVAQWRRMAVLRIWENGVRGPGVVIGLRHSATAPFSRIVRFALADHDDKRVLTAIFPNRAAPQPGDAITLIYPHDRPDKAIVAELYAGPAGPPQEAIPQAMGFEVVPPPASPPPSRSDEQERVHAGEATRSDSTD